MVAGEGEEGVAVVPAAQHPIDDEPVRLDDVDPVVGCVLHGEVAEVDAVRPVGANRDVTLEPGVEHDVLGSGAGALDLEVAEASVATVIGIGPVAQDGDQVLDVGAGHVLLVRKHGLLRQCRALRRRRSETRLLGVGARLDQDPCARYPDGIDSRLQVAEPAPPALGVQALVRRPQYLRQVGD